VIACVVRIGPSGRGGTRLRRPAGRFPGESGQAAPLRNRSRRARILRVFGNERFPVGPEIPTAAGQGFPGIDRPVWFDLFAPAQALRARRPARPGCRTIAVRARGLRQVPDKRDREMGHDDRGGRHRADV